MTTTSEACTEVEAVDVSYIHEATYADILALGIAQLSLRDATVINKVVEPSHIELVRLVNELVQSISSDESVQNYQKRYQVKCDIEDSSYYQELVAFYRKFTGDPARRVERPMLADGVSPQKRFGNNTQGPHYDYAPLAENSPPTATINTTLFIANLEASWYWGLSKDLSLTQCETPRNYETQVPLATGNMVILGESALKDDKGVGHTVLHEVLSPEEAWETDGVERVKVTLF